MTPAWQGPWLDWGILGPAWLAGLLVLATHVPLGLQVLRRGIIFIDLAIAQVVGLGLMLAHSLGWSPQGWGVQAVAVGAALGGAALLTWTEHRWPDIQEALIGALFVVASSAGVLLVAGNPHGGEHLKDLLVGQILWVSEEQLLAMAALTALVVLCWVAWGQALGRAGFYILFALSVTASVQLVGVYLVFASLILPALVWRRAQGVRQWLGAYLLGALAYGLGLAASAWLDWPSGAVVVVTMACLSVLAAWLLSPAAGVSPRQGESAV